MAIGLHVDVYNILIFSYSIHICIWMIVDLHDFPRLPIVIQLLVTINSPFFGVTNWPQTLHLPGSQRGFLSLQRMEGCVHRQLSPATVPVP